MAYQTSSFGCFVGAERYEKYNKKQWDKIKKASCQKYILLVKKWKEQ